MAAGNGVQAGGILAGDRQPQLEPFGISRNEIAYLPAN
jgi:hypothetical protein